MPTEFFPGEAKFNIQLGSVTIIYIFIYDNLNFNAFVCIFVFEMLYMTQDTLQAIINVFKVGILISTCKLFWGIFGRF